MPNMLGSSIPHLVEAVGINHKMYGRVKSLKIKISGPGNLFCGKWAYALAIYNWGHPVLKIPA